MWILAPDKHEFIVPKGAVRKSISSLQEGEIFSLNAKSKKFAFSRLASSEKEDQSMAIVAHELIGSEQVGKSVVFPYLEYQNREVISWGMLPIAKAQANDDIEIFDRVSLLDESNGKILGTVIDINDVMFPDRDATVLYDVMTNNQWTGEHPIHEIRALGAKAKGNVLQAAKQARPVVRELRDQQEKRTMMAFQQASRTAMARLTAGKIETQERADYQKRVDQETRSQARTIAQYILSTHASDYRSIVDAGLTIITAGEFNYDIRKAAEMVASHAELIRTHAESQTPSMRLQFLAAQNVASQLTALIHDGYFLIREGYILQLPQGSWEVYYKNGALQERLPTKKAAQCHLRNVEAKKRYGVSEEK